METSPDQTDPLLEDFAVGEGSSPSLTTNETMDSMKMAKTPLPKKQFFVLAIIALSEPLDLVFLFPFVYFMVEDFGVAPDETQIGLYVGILSSSFPASQFMTSLLWGYLSDKFGRKPILLFGVFGSSIAMICFGFSTNYWMALGFRITAGLLNGNIGITKTIVGEITDKTNRSKGFSMIGFITGFGLILGPMIGGFLSNPAEQFPEQFGDSQFFLTYRYCLPCIVTGGISLLGALVGIFMLEETLPSLRKRTDEEIARLVDEPEEFKPTTKEIAKELFSPIVLASVFGYGIISFASIMLDEAFAIWSEEGVEDNGLGLDSMQVGLVLTFSGFVLLFTQVVLYPTVSRFVGSVGLYSICMLISVPIYLCYPLINMIVEKEDQTIYTGAGSEVTNLALFWSMLLLVVSVRTILLVFSFTASIIIISNCTRMEYLGSVNGLGQMIASGFRSLGPFMAGSIWSWSLANNKSFPLNYSFVFLIAACICFFGFLLGLFIPSSVNNPKIIVELDATLSVDSYTSATWDDDVNLSVQSYGSFTR